MGNRRRAVLMVAIATVLLTTSCTGSSGGGGPTGGIKEGGVLRIGTGEGISSLNPFVGFNQDDFNVWMYIYPSLLQYDTTTPMFDYAPGFAQTWEQSTDGLTWTFHTTPNATWSDGEALTADDVAWTLNTILKYKDGPTSAWAGSVASLASVKATDPNTLVATYERPFAIAEFQLGLTPILPPQVWQQYAVGDGKALKTFPNEPVNGQPLVGGGPFVLTEYRKNDVALFKKNPTFYGPKPHIDGFGLQFFESADAMVTALKTDQLDAIETLPPTSVAALPAPAFHVYEGPALVLRDFIINSVSDKPEHRELLNPKVRQALEYAIDRDSIVQTAWLGYATPGTTIIPAGNATGGVEWHDPDIQSLPYDLAKANEILDQLGYAKGADGIRIAEGHPMVYDVIFPHAESGAGDRAFQIIQHGFAQIGVKLIQKKMDDNAAFAAMTGPDNKYLNWDLAMWDWYPAADPDFILSVLLCDQFGAWNDTGYCDPAYDELYREQQGAVDPQQRQQIIFQMQQMIYDARPYIILTYDERLDAWSSKWDGFVESVQGFFNNFSTQSLTSVHQT